MAEELGVQAAVLYAGGSSFAVISKDLEVSKSRVGNLIRNGIESLRNNGARAQQVNAPENEGNLLSPYEGNPGLNETWEKRLIIQAAPILRKVVLNSKVFLQHEYFQKHLGYQGDIGDLLVEALNFYWSEMGFSIKITHDSVI